MPRRLLAAGAVLSLLAALLLSAGPAQAAPVPVTIDGAVSVFGTTATTTYTVTVTGALTDLSVTTVQDAALPADDASVTDAKIDSLPAPAGAVTRTGPDLAFDLGPRAPGTYTVTFPVSIPSPAPATYSSTALATFTVAGDASSTTVPSAPVLVTVGGTSAPPVDLAVFIENNSPADDPTPLGTNDIGDVFAYVDNAGTATTTASVLIDAGTGLIVGDVIGDDGVTPLTCAAVPGHPEQKLCAVPAIAPGEDHGQFLDIEVAAAPTAVTGTSAALTVTVAPTPDASVEADPSDNSDETYFQFAGQADLSYSLTPATARVTVGKTVSVRATVSNAGPDDAPGTLALAALAQRLKHFAIVGFTGQTVAISGTSIGLVPTRANAGQAMNADRAALVRARALLARHAAIQARPEGAVTDPDVLLWSIGTLAPGQSASATLTLKATTPGTEPLMLVAISAAGDPDCADPLGCPPAQTVLTAVAPVAAVIPTHSPVIKPPTPMAPTAPVAPELPDTGAPTGRLGLAGLILLLGGALLIRTGRRRGLDRG